MKGGKFLIAYLCGVFALSSTSIVFASEIERQNNNEELPIECGTLTTHYGPFDYTNYQDYSQRLGIVEAEHFTHEIETLIKGKTDVILGDIDYTLKAFPNHHRALASISNFEFQVEDAAMQIELVGMGPECYFKRAIAFKPLDGVVRLIYGAYLHRKNNLEGASKQYAKALKIHPQSAEVHYNIALMYLDSGKTDLAVEHGHKAYELGYPLQGLKEKLVKKGLWGRTVSQN